MKYTAQYNGETELGLHLLNADDKKDLQKEHEWLSDQFNRVPYIIYKFWLILTSIIALSIQPNLILSQFEEPKEALKVHLAILSVSSFLGLLGCGEMLFAIVKLRSAFAQKGLIKLQYSIVGTIIGFCGMNAFDYHPSFLFDICVDIAFPVSLIIGIFGGLAVLRTFKKNHPLVRLEGPQDADFLEQNGVIACELLKYDKQLERWPYKVYKFWLKIVIAVEIILIASLALYYMFR